MKKVYVLMLCIILWGFSISTSFGATVYLETATPSVIPGSDFDVLIKIDDVPNPGLTSWLVDLKVTGPATINNIPAFDGAWFITQPDPDAANVPAQGLGGGTFGTPPQGDEILLVTLTLECLGAGDVDFELLDHFPTGAGSAFVLADNSSLDADMTFQGLTVNQVPIPGAIWLLGSALVGLVGIRSRRMRRS